MIKSWANRTTQRFAEEGKSGFSGLDEGLARRLLRLLDEAERLDDLSGLKSIGLHRCAAAAEINGRFLPAVPGGSRSSSGMVTPGMLK